MFHRSFLLCVMVFAWHFAAAQAPKYSNEFLSLGVGARSLGMANVQTAFAIDATAAYWNPAGLASLTCKHQATLMHASYFAGIANYDYAGFATAPDSASGLGFSVIRFAIDDIPDTRYLYDANGAINYDNIRFFSAADYAFLISYGRKAPWLDGLNIGASVKVVHRKVGDFASAWGFGIDAGAQLAVKKWQFGLMARDITTTFNAWSHNPEMVEEVYVRTGNAIPDNTIEITLPKAVFGVARRWEIARRFHALTALDFDVTFDGERNVPVRSKFASVDPHAGIELGYAETAFVRAGVKNFQQVKDFDGSLSWTYQPDFGIGIRIEKFSVDYAFTDIGDQAESLYSHVFSLMLGFD